MIRTEGPRTGHLRDVGVIVRDSLARPARLQHSQLCDGAGPIPGCGALGVGLVFHDLHRTFVGDLIDAGADLSSVSKIVGHSNPATTTRHGRRG